jgi:DNA repair protein RecO (recombination protein O)
MATEKAVALVLRTTDWSESSRIATLWTREFGKVRALAKGGRRLKSNFESALDLLTLCRIVVLRKSSGSLDLLTEAQVVERFARLRQSLPALYAAYYIAELLADWTQEYDPHPALFDEALAALRDLGQPGVEAGPRVARFELATLRELGYTPALEGCAACGAAAVVSADRGVAFSPAAGGVVCADCRPRHRDACPLSPGGWRVLREEARSWRETWDPAVRNEVRQVLNRYVTYLWGRRPRLLPYLGS